ncbi:short chain dehydrogenase reductase [Lophiotrema nucula]|uniref:Short chain dehydrogenase reductase n=1 Tax=Lophiotrema nucula TaxID=690887 RepID=A0A6A5ZMX4_9PLEO|nr:short chain dehydrogenase reductase [Lophiotrema nucula]
MASLTITEASIPDLSGKTAIVTGGSSGIGLGAVQVLLDHGARVFILDISPPPADVLFPHSSYIHTDISSWSALVSAFAAITQTHGCAVDIAIANAGVGEFDENSYLAQCFNPAPDDASAWAALGQSDPWAYKQIEVNLKGTLNFVMLATRVMKTQKSGGSIVLTASTTAYFPETSIPIYSATKGALANLIRALHPTLPLHNIAISGVAPSAADTAMLPPEVPKALVQLGLPVSTGRHVGLALVYSATATQSERVEDYGKDKPVSEDYRERWNGRIIHTIGDEFWEVEQKLVETRALWWGKGNLDLTMKQRIITDPRPI